MMDWDEANRAARGFMRGMLGPGYVPEYYQQFADEIVALLKMCETPDPETVQPTSAEAPSPRGSMTFAQAEALLVEYQREKLERQARERG